MKRLLQIVASAAFAAALGASVCCAAGAIAADEPTPAPRAKAIKPPPPKPVAAIKAKPKAEAKKAKPKEPREEIKQAKAKEEKKKKRPAPPGYEEAAAADEAPRDINQIDVAAEMAAAMARARGLAKNVRQPAVIDLKFVQENFDLIENAQGKAKDNAQVLVVQRQFLPQFTALVTAELLFIDGVCQLTPAQGRLALEHRKKIADVASLLYARRYSQMQQGGFRRQQSGEGLHPRNLVHLAATAAIGKSLQPEQTKRLQEEIEKRAAALRRATVLMLVSRLDDRLSLSARQREQLVKSLTENWQDSWGSSLTMLANGNDQFFPKLPAKLVLPFLNLAQKKQFGFMQAQLRNRFIWGGGFGFEQTIIRKEDFSAAKPAAGS